MNTALTTAEAELDHQHDLDIAFGPLLTTHTLAASSIRFSQQARTIVSDVAHALDLEIKQTRKRKRMTGKVRLALKKDELERLQQQLQSAVQLVMLALQLHTKYVLSASNPADGPSRGIFPATRQLSVPPIPDAYCKVLSSSTKQSDFVNALLPPSQEEVTSNSEMDDITKILLTFEQTWDW